MDKQTLDKLEDIRLDLSRMRARFEFEIQRIEEFELAIGKIVQKEDEEIEKMLTDLEVGQTIKDSFKTA